MTRRLRPVALLAVAAAVTLSACLPVGELQEERRVVESEGALSAEIEFDMGMGELRLQGGADKLMEAGFFYNIKKWKPRIDYHVSGDRGRLSVRQGESSGIPVGNGRNRWEIDLNEDIPLDILVDFGAGEGRLDLEGMDVRSLRVDMGVGDLTIDLTGPRRSNVEVDIDGGVGSAKLILPRETGVRVRVDKGIGSVDARDFVRRGEFYTNPAYGESEFTINITIDAGIGSIDLRMR